MRKNILHIISICFCIACSSTDYQDEPCTGLTPMNETHTLKIGDTIPDFRFVTFTDNTLNISSLNKNKFFIFFKKNNGANIFLNKEIPHKSMAQAAQKKQCDLLIISDLKAAKIYGVDITKNNQIANTLFIVSKNKTIEKIYTDICENEIVDLMNNQN